MGKKKGDNMSNIFYKLQYAYAAYQWKRLLGPGVMLIDVESNYEWSQWKQYKKELRK